MTYIDSIRCVFTKHKNRENQSIGKTNFKHQPGKNSPTKSTISNSVQKKQQKKPFSDAMTNHKSAGGAFSHHVLLKKVRKRKTKFRNPLLTSVLNRKPNKQNINNFSMGAANII